MADAHVSSPLVFLSPELAHEVNVATYIHIGTTTVLIWDTIDNLRNDYRIVFRYKAGLQTFVYFITRILLLVYSLGRMVLLTAPIPDCGKFEMILSGFLAAFVSGTTLLFYLRVYALYPSNISVRVFFGVIWLTIVGMSTTFVKSFTARHLGPTDYCIEDVKGHFLGPTAILLLLSDILTYIALTYRLYKVFLDSDSSTKQRIRLAFFGASLPIFWKVVLLDSELYLMVNIISKLVIVFTVHLCKAPISIMFFICHLVLANILSGRIFRTIKMAYDRTDGPLSTDIKTELKFASNPISRVQTQVTFPPWNLSGALESVDSQLERGKFQNCSRLEVSLGESMERDWRAVVDESFKERVLHPTHLL